jgi:TetR/AcrR family transcriptional repressor of nem operon
MRFEKGHKAATRQKIIENAAARFRQDGIAATGIAGLMADAGLTHGGFYAHFGSKEELVREAVEAAAAASQARLQRAGAQASGLEGYIRAYLRPAHRDAPAQGCVIAALGAELARHEPETRAAFSVQIETLLARIADQLPAEQSPEARREAAIGIFGVMNGTLQLARAVADEALSNQILASGIAAALKLAGLTNDAGEQAKFR